MPSRHCGAAPAAAAAAPRAVDRSPRWVRRPAAMATMAPRWCCGRPKVRHKMLQHSGMDSRSCSASSHRSSRCHSNSHMQPRPQLRWPVPVPPRTDGAPRIMASPTSGSCQDPPGKGHRPAATTSSPISCATWASVRTTAASRPAARLMPPTSARIPPRRPGNSWRRPISGGFQSTPVVSSTWRSQLAAQLPACSSSTTISTWTKTKNWEPQQPAAFVTLAKLKNKNWGKRSKQAEERPYTSQLSWSECFSFLKSFDFFYIHTHNTHLKPRENKAN